MTSVSDERIENLLRDLAPQILGILLRRFHDFARCEDAVQEALIAAADQWPRQGLPESPRAWLVRVAVRRMSDLLRSEAARKRREAIASADVATALAPFTNAEAESEPDD